MCKAGTEIRKDFGRRTPKELFKQFFVKSCYPHNKDLISKKISGLYHYSLFYVFYNIIKMLLNH